MRKYLKPAIEMEAFEVKDVIMDASSVVDEFEFGGDNIDQDYAGGNNAAAPISGVEFN